MNVQFDFWGVLDKLCGWNGQRVHVAVMHRPARGPAMLLNGTLLGTGDDRETPQHRAARIDLWGVKAEERLQRRRAERGDSDYAWVFFHVGSDDTGFALDEADFTAARLSDKAGRETLEVDSGELHLVVWLTTPDSDDHDPTAWLGDPVGILQEDVGALAVNVPPTERKSVVISLVDAPLIENVDVTATTFLELDLEGARWLQRTLAAAIAQVEEHGE